MGTIRIALVMAFAVCAAAPSTAVGKGPAAAGPFLPGPPVVREGVPEPPLQIRNELASPAPTRSQAMRDVSGEAIAYYVSEFGVDEDEARYRLATQAMAPDAGTTLKESLGASYTDVWWDNFTGQLVVLATPAASKSAIFSALEERNLSEGDYRVEHVRYGHADLLAAVAATRERLRGLVRDGLATVGMGSGKVVVTLAAKVDDDKRVEVRSANERLSGTDTAPQIRTVQSARQSLEAEPAACSTTYHYCNEIIGGGGYYNATSGCTWSYFVAWQGRNPWVPSILTAGHCLNQQPLVASQSTCKANGTGCGSVGLSLQYFFGYGRADAGMIDLYAHNWTIFGGWWNWGPGNWTALGSLAWTPPGVGYVVCKNGATSGSSCGSVQQSSVNVAVGGVMQTGMIQTTGVTTCRGDSGGPVTSASVPAAVGIVSGAVLNDPGGNCGTSTQYDTPIWQPIYYFNLDWYSGGPYGPFA